MPTLNGGAPLTDDIQIDKASSKLTLYTDSKYVDGDIEFNISVKPGSAVAGTASADVDVVSGGTNNISASIGAKSEDQPSSGYYIKLEAEGSGSSAVTSAGWLGTGELTPSSATAVKYFPITTGTITPNSGSVNSTGLVTIPYTKTAGYIAAGQGSSTYQLPVLAAQTYPVSSLNQSITSGQYLAGDQTILGVTTSGISSDNIRKGATVSVGDSVNGERITSVDGMFTDSSTVSPNQHAAASGQILSGYSAWVDGSEVKGNIATKSSSDITVDENVVTVSGGYYATTNTVTVATGEITSGSATISSISYEYNSSSGKFDVGGSASIAQPIINKAGYISSTKGDKHGNTANVLTTVDKITGSVSISGTKMYTPSIEKQSVPAGVTDAASGGATTTPPSSGVYVAVKSPENSGNVTAGATISKNGYGTSASHGIAGSGNVKVGANASSMTYIPISTTSVSINGDVVSYGSGWVNSGSQTVQAGTVVANVSANNPGSATIAATGFTPLASGTSDYYVTLTTSPGSVKASAAGGTSGYITPEITDETSAVNVAVTANKSKIYIPAGSVTASVVNNTSGGASMSANGFTKSNTATSYYVSLATSPGSVKAKADGNAAGYITSSTTYTTPQATSVAVTGNGDKLYIPAAAIAGSVTNATATTTVAPGTVSVSKQSTPSGVTNAASGDATTTAPSSGVYVAVMATAAANSTGTTSSISGSGTATVSTAGYAPTSLTGTVSVSGTATAKTSVRDSLMTYIPITTTSASVSGKTVSYGSGWITAGSKNVAVGTITSGSATITSVTYTYSSDNENFSVTGSASIGAPTVGTAGYVSSSEGTKNGNTASLSTSVAKIAGSVSISGTKMFTPDISKQNTPSGVTNAASGNATTTAPTSGVYVAVKSAKKSGNVTAAATISTAGYGTSANHGIAGSGNVEVGANASSVTYVPITTTSASVSGRTVSYGSGWISSGSKSVDLGTVTSGSAVISSATYTYDSTNSNFTVTGSASIGAPSVGTAGYISSSEGTRNGNTATLSTTVAKIAGSISISGTKMYTPSITKQATPTGVINAASGDATTTAPSSGVYVAVKSAKKSGNVSASATISTDGYGTSSYHGISGSGNVAVGANASSTTYIPITTTTATVSGKTVSYGSGWITAGSKDVAVGTITSGSATISSASYTYNSTNSNFTVSGSAAIGAPSVGTAGYVSSTEGTKNGNTATLSTTVAKIAGSIAITGTKMFTPAISKQNTPTGVTNAASGAATTTAPSSGVYVAVKSAKNSGNVSAAATISTDGYGTSANHGIAGSGNVEVGANASSTTYIPITTTSASVSGKTVSYGNGWIVAGSKSVADGTVVASVSANTAGSATMGATGFTAASSATSYYVTLTTTAGSVKAKAAGGTEGYVTSSTTNETGATSVAVSGNGNKLYIPTTGVTASVSSNTGGTASIAPTGFTAAGSATSYYVTLTTAAGSVKAKAVGNGTGIITSSTSNETSATSVSVSGNGNKVYIPTTGVTASVSANSGGSASMAATGFTASSSATSYYVTLSTTAGSVKAKAVGNGTGMVTSSTSNETSATSVAVSGNGNKLYIPAASPTFKGGAVSGTATASSSTGASLSTTTNNSGITIAAAASATRAKVQYNAAVAGYVSKAASADAYAAGSATALTGTTYYLNGVTLATPASGNARTFTVTAPSGGTNHTYTFSQGTDGRTTIKVDNTLTMTWNATDEALDFIYS